MAKEEKGNRFHKFYDHFRYTSHRDRICDRLGRTIHVEEFYYWCLKFEVVIDKNRLEREYDQCIHEFYLKFRDKAYHINSPLDVHPPEWVYDEAECVKRRKRIGGIVRGKTVYEV